MKRNDVLGKILRRGLLPIVIGDELPVLPCVEKILEAGFEAIEVSCRHSQSLAVIGELKTAFPQLAIGAASLIEDGRYRQALVATRNIPTIGEAIDAGADRITASGLARGVPASNFNSVSTCIPGEPIST